MQETKCKSEKGKGDFDFQPQTFLLETRFHYEPSVSTKVPQRRNFWNEEAY
jgi:hypothetical protein